MKPDRILIHASPEALELMRLVIKVSKRRGDRVALRGARETLFFMKTGQLYPHITT